MLFDKCSKEITLDLSLIFNETDYIDTHNRCTYCNNNNVTNIILIQSINAPVKIGDAFIYNCEKLIFVDTSKLINVIAIGNRFLSLCRNLKEINATGLTGVIAIGNYFLSDCCNLTFFDTTVFTSLITVGDGFFAYCYKLTNIDTTGLTKITTIENNFLFRCENLTIFDTTGLISLTTIKYNFLYNCNKNLTIIVKKPVNCLYEQLSKTNYKIIQLCDKPCIYLDNDCVI